MKHKGTDRCNVLITACDIVRYPREVSCQRRENVNAGAMGHQRWVANSRSLSWKEKQRDERAYVVDRLFRHSG
jgi:hypothetical protein